MKGYSVFMSSLGAKIVQSSLFGTRNGLLGTGTIAQDQDNQIRTLVAFGQSKNMLVSADKLLSNNQSSIIN